jgi:hypothetical protein
MAEPIITEAIRQEILKIYPEADFTKYKFGVSNKHPLFNKLRGIGRREQRSEYNKREEVKEQRRVNQKKYYAEDPEIFKKRNQKYISKPEVQQKRRADQQRRYYYEGDREKALLRLKGTVASKGYGGYFKNPDNALLKDMVRMAEQNPNSGLEIIRKGPRNLIVGVKEGDIIYSAVASKRKPVAYAPKKSVPITEHPDFKTRFEFTKQQKNFANTKVKGTDITYGKALDALQSDKAGTPLQNKNAAEFEHIKGAATDYKEGQIARRTANRDKQLILSSLKNNNISLEEADKQLKKIGVRAFVDNKYIGAPKINAAKQFKDLKKYVDRSLSSKKEFTAGKETSVLLQAVKNAPQACRKILNYSTGGISTTCAAAIETDPVKAATALEEIKPTSAALGKVRNAASAFLKFAGKGKVFGATAAVGVGAGALVKKFMNDDPSTYLTNDAQANAMILDTIDEKERQERMEAMGDAPELLGESAIGAELAATAAAIPGSGAVYGARKKPFTRMVDGVKKTRPAMGTARAALGPVGKALSGFATPAGIAALTPLNVASSLYEGDSGYEIATDPLNYLAPAFAGTLSKEATRGMGAASKLSKSLRLGMSPGAIKMVSRRFGLPGLALSGGISLYELADDYKMKRGMFGKKE